MDEIRLPEKKTTTTNHHAVEKFHKYFKTTNYGF